MRVRQQIVSALAFALCLPAAWGQIVISEFVAENNAGLADEDGERADWLELYNPSTSTVSLAGWRLTDDAASLTKWTFPAISLAPYEFLVVFASDKDRTNWPGTLHTNFRLSAGGEYLALVRPDGTVAQEYAPEFPAQSADVSFGLEILETDIHFTDFGSPCVAWPADGLVTTDWVALTGVDDSGWLAGAVGVGFDLQPDYLPLVGLNLQAGMYEQKAAAKIRVPFVVSELPTLKAFYLDLKLDDGLIAWLNGCELVRVNAPSGDAWTDPQAPAACADALATNYVSSNITHAITSLVADTNVLAILGLNVATNDDDFLIVPRLRGVQWTIPDPAPVFLAQPTPGAVNAPALDGAVADVAFSVARGLFTEPFTVTVSSATASATLRYTLDGSAPSPSNGVAVMAVGTNTPAVVLAITNTTLLRAKAFRAGWRPSATATMTYLFLPSVLTQPANPPGFPGSWGSYAADYAMDRRIVTNEAYRGRMIDALRSLPTMSIVTEVSNVFGSSQGIYVYPTAEGPDWERGVSVEWMDAATTNTWQIDAGLRIQGGYFRQASVTPKHSFRLIFRGRYGATALTRTLFDEPGAAAWFDSITLRAQGNDGYSYSWANGANVLYLRDQFGREIMRDLGQAAPHGTHCHLYLNGLYWGLYNPVEHADESFSAAYFGGDKSTWDAINSGELISGTMAAWNALLAACATDMTSVTNYMKVQGCNPDGTPNPAYPDHIEIDNFIDYMLLNIWGGNWDWPGKNYWVGRNRVGTDGFRFYVWDYEDTVGTKRSPLGAAASTGTGVAAPHPSLRASPEYRLRFADRIQRHFFTQGTFAPTSLIARFTNLAGRIAPALVAESARWGDQRYAVPYTPADWEAAVSDIVRNYLPYRTEIVLAQLRAAGLYPTTAAPVFSQLGGLVPPDYPLILSAAGPDVYFTVDGTDPRQFATGAAVGTRYTNEIAVRESCFIRARALSNGVWSALVEAPFVVNAPSSLRLSEIMSHARGPDAAEAAAGYRAHDFDFLELHNAGGAPAGWAGYVLTGGVRFDFTRPGLVSLAPGAYALLVRNAAAFTMRYGTDVAARIVGVYTNDLKNEGEPLALERPLTGERLSFVYDHGAGWPARAAGAGHSLVPRTEADATGHALNYGGNWRASACRDGSPGAPDPEPPADLLVNEIAANTATNLPGHDANDWLELYNASSGAVGFADWYLSDDADDLAKWALPSNGSLAAASWVVFDEISGFHADTNAGFGLAAAGESVFLSFLPGSAEDRVADAVTFGGQAQGRTRGRFADGEAWWRAMPPTPGASNRLAVPSVAISEIMFHPPDTGVPPHDNVRDEYLEFHNGGDQPAPLANANGPWRIAGSVGFTFPAGIELAAGERILAVSFDPADGAELAAFAAAHGITGTLPRVFGPYAGHLPNDTGRVALECPVAPNTPGDPMIWVAEDDAVYFDDAPWTRGADGNGLALHRLAAAGHGDDPANWRAGLPSVGEGAVAYPPLDLSIGRETTGGVRIAWPSRAGMMYGLETTTDPNAAWTNAGAIQATGATSAVPIPDAGRHLLLRGRQSDR